MNIPNPLKAHDWNFTPFVTLIAVVQLAVWAVIGLDELVLRVPLLRALVVLIDVAFVPGLILLRVARLHTLSTIESALYAIGLSLTTVMLTGLFMNVVYPRILTAQPLTLLPFMLTLTALIAGFTVLAWYRDRTYARPTFMDVHELITPPVLAASLLPFVSVFGAYAFNVSGSALGTTITLLAVAVVVLTCAFTTRVPSRSYGVVVLAVSLALLLHTALITNFLIGFDIQLEHFVSQYVLSNGVWGAPPRPADYNLLNLNAMLSITVLAPLLSVATGLSLVWVYKLIIPLLFALVPLGLYQLFEKQTSARVALFAVFAFVAASSFYSMMIGFARQEIAEFFLVLLLLLVVDTRMSRRAQLGLFVLFGFSLIVSHYAVTYVFLFCMVLAWGVVMLTRRYNLARRRRTQTDTHEDLPRSSQRQRVPSGISGWALIALVVLTFCWYGVANNPQPLSGFLGIANLTLAFVGRTLHIAIGPLNFANAPVEGPASGAGGLDRTGLQTILVSHYVLYDVTKYLLIIVVAVSLLGILFAYKQRRKLTLAPEFVAYSLANGAVLCVCLVVPYFAASLGISRFIHLAQVALSLFFVLGFVGIVHAFRTLRVRSTAVTSRGALQACACFTVLFLLFSSGLIYKASGEVADSPTLIGLDQTIDTTTFTDREMAAAQWLSDYNNGTVRADYFRFYGVYAFNGPIVRWGLPADGYWGLPSASYLFLGTANVNAGTMVTGANEMAMTTVHQDATYFTGGANCVYTNGGGQIYAA